MFSIATKQTKQVKQPFVLENVLFEKDSFNEPIAEEDALKEKMLSLQEDCRKLCKIVIKI